MVDLLDVMGAADLGYEVEDLCGCGCGDDGMCVEPARARVLYPLRWEVCELASHRSWVLHKGVIPIDDVREKGE